jgi:hypothetical protein
MRCFYHGDVDAVAICKSCGRGICHDCSAEVGTSVARRNRCEDEVASLNDLLQRNKSTFQKASAIYTRSGIFLTALGVIFGGLGLLNWINGDRGPFLPIFGVVFILYGFSQFGAARRYREK